MSAPTTTPSRPAPQVATPTPGTYLRAGATVYALTETGGWDRNGPVMCNRFTANVQSGTNCRPDEPEATAQLLAAAPAMRDALLDLVLAIGTGCTDLTNEVLAARSALAIAQGAAPAGGANPEEKP